MIKKILIGFIFILCLNLNMENTFAFDKEYENNTNNYIESLYDDGSYMEVTINQSISYTRSSTTSGNKTYTYKDKNGKVLWSINLFGKFTYGNNTSQCTYSSITTSCPASNWKISNKKVSKSGSSAIGSVTAKEYTFLGICAKTIDKSVKLTCDKYGKLS